MEYQHQFNSANYPRVYVASTAWRLFMGFFGAVLSIGGLLGIWYFVTGHEVRNQTGMLLMVGISIALSLLGFACALPILRFKLILTPNSVEIHGGFKFKQIRRTEIAGYRTKTLQGIKILELMPKHSKAGAMKVEMLFNPDTLFLAWFAGIDDLDRIERAASTLEIELDSKLGDSPQQRLNKIAQAKRIANVFKIATSLSLAWALWFPLPYDVMVMTISIVPWIAFGLCWVSGRSFTLEDSGNNSLRADLTLPLIMPGFILSLRALQDIHLLDWTGLILPSVLLSMILACLVAWLTPVLRKKFGRLVMLLVMLIPYPASLISIANVRLDQAQPDFFRVNVLNKRVTTGKGASQYFTVSSWGPNQGSSDIQVGRDFYQKHEIGASICIPLYAGALGLEWYSYADGRTCQSFM